VADGDLYGVRGAVYVPARAYNAYQTWRDYDPDETERDLGYARTVNLNALRVFLSYEYWLHAPTDHEERLEHLLDAADERDVGILPILFESAGRPPRPGILTDRDPTTAAAVRSPGHVAVRNLPVPGSIRGPYGIARLLRRLVRRRSWWEEAAAFVERVLDRFGDHPALLALEVMNEPGGWDQREAFARSMLASAHDHPADVPLTMGCATLSNNDRFAVPGLDVHQFHYNVPPTTESMADRLDLVRAHAAERERPVWLTEWQRTREEPPPVLLPNYESLVPLLRDADLAGDFLWSLMLKPAYLPIQRRRGRLNGLFRKDGAVYSLADARAVAGETDLELPERRGWPTWADDLAARVGAPRPE
jgi:hypothetical protein